MSHNNLTTQLSNLAKNDREMLPSPEWVVGNRAMLLKKIAQREAMHAASYPSSFAIVQEFLATFLPLQTISMLARAMSIVLLAIVSVIGGGAVSAAAYKDAVPGEALYGAKRIVESAQLFIAPTLTSKTKLYTEFADNRIEEVSRLIESESDGVDAPAKLEEAIRGYGVALAGVKQGIGELESRSAETTVEVAKMVERKLAAHQEALARVRVLAPELSGQVAVVRQEVDTVSVTTMALLVESHLSNSGSASAEIVSQRFAERIKTAEGEVDDALAHGQVTEDVAAKAKTAIAQAKELVKQEEYQAALSKIVEVAKLTTEDAEIEEEKEGEIGEGEVSEENKEVDIETSDVITESSLEKEEMPSEESSVEDPAVSPNP